APIPQPTEPLVLREPRSAVSQTRLPTERLPRQFAAPDVERPIDDHLEREPRPGPELQYPHPTLVPIPERHQPYPRDLAEPPPPPPATTPAAPPPPPQSRPSPPLPPRRLPASPPQCITRPPSIAIICPVMNEAASPARKTTRLPMSSGVPRRLILCCSST